MKKIFFTAAFFSFFLIFQTEIQSFNYCDGYPFETIVLSFFDNSETNWKEIGRCVTANKAIVESIPINQTEKNWSELICIQFFENESNKIEAILETLPRKIYNETLVSYPKEIMTWQVIEKKQNYFIYEWILHKKYKTSPPQYCITKVFVTNKGIHCIGFTNKKGRLDPKERSKWIKLLTERCSVVSFEEGASSIGLSLADSLMDTVSLDEGFANWKVLNIFSTATGYTMMCHVPPSQNDGYLAECLEVTTMPNNHSVSIDRFFEGERAGIQSVVGKSVKLNVLKKDSQEIIYSYSYPKDHLQANVIVRLFLTDHGYYSISYKLGLNRSMSQDEILLNKHRLEKIKVTDKMKPIPSISALK